MNVPLVTSRADIRHYANQQVRLIGRYQQYDTRYMSTPPPEYRGQVGITLADGTRVLVLPAWQAAAIRPTAEIEQFDGHTVEVIGYLVAKAPDRLPDGQQAATIIAPCLLSIDSIGLAST